MNRVRWIHAVAHVAVAGVCLSGCKSRSFNTNSTEGSGAAGAAAALPPASPALALTGVPATESAQETLPLFRVQRPYARLAQGANGDERGPWNLSPFDAAEEVPDIGATRELLVREAPRARIRTDAAFDATLRGAVRALTQSQVLRGRLTTFPRSGSSPAFAGAEIAPPETVSIPLVSLARAASLATVEPLDGNAPQSSITLIRTYAQHWPYLEAYSDLGAAARRPESESLVLSRAALVKTLRVEAARAAIVISGRAWSDFVRRNDALLRRLGCRLPTPCASLFERYLQESEGKVAFPYAWKKKSAADIAAVGRVLGLLESKSRPEVDVELWDDLRSTFESDPVRVRGVRELLAVSEALESALAQSVRGFAGP